MGIFDFFKKLYSLPGKINKAETEKTEKSDIEEKIENETENTDRESLISDILKTNFDESSIIGLYTRICRNVSQEEKNDISEKFLTLIKEEPTYNEVARKMIEEYKNFIK